MAEPAAAESAPWYLRWGNVAQIGSAVFALVGFTAVVWQIDEARERNTRDDLRQELIEARKAYMSYSDATLRYPELSNPDYAALMRDRINYVRYQNFFSHMLYAYDEVIGVLRTMGDRETEREWALALHIDLEPHQRYICQMPDPRMIKTFRPFMQAYLDDARRQCQGFQPLTEVRP